MYAFMDLPFIVWTITLLIKFHIRILGANALDSLIVVDSGQATQFMRVLRHHLTDRKDAWSNFVRCTSICQ